MSLLGDYYYDFPAPIPLEHRLKDVLETDVDERYYLKDATVQMYEDYVAKKQAEGCGFDFAPTDWGVALCIRTRAGSRTDDNYIEERNDAKKAN